jgi:error-prone DNA polymerase
MSAPLHVHSNFSLLRGASPVEEMVARAAALGYAALALTDRDALYGAVRFAKACAAAGLRPIIGSEVTVDSGHHLTLLAESQAGYANLCRLLSRAHQGQDKGKAALPFATLADHAGGLIALSGPRTGVIPQLLLAGRRTDATRAANGYREVYGERFCLEVQNHLLPDDAWLMAELAALGKARQIDLVATTDVHYHHPSRRIVQDVLTCIRTKTTMAVPSSERLPNGHFALKAPDELRGLFRDYPEALARTDALADRGAVTLDFRHARFPPPDLPVGETPDAALRRLCLAGAHERYHPLAPKVLQQLEHELSVVATTGLAPFFLIAADVVLRFNGRCRGSAAGSLIVYCLGLSVADPLTYNLLFERFINSERPTMPDIDVDFSEPDRERAIAYVYQRYGAERAAMVCNYVRFRARSAVRDVGKALGMPAAILGPLAKSLDHGAAGADLAQGIADFASSLGDHRADENQRAPPPWPLLTRICQEIDDYPRHLSIHVGGMLLTGQPLVELFGLEPARKAGIVVVGADKDDVEDAGLGKLDLLCLRALSVVQEAEALERHRGVSLDLRQINLEDPAIYRMLSRADTIGASQVESRAQMQSVVRTQPSCFRDLINQCAIIRPGPVVAGMVHPYNRRRLGLERVSYLHPLLEPITRDTLGILLFQEQILLAVSALTGCSAGEADVFRRAMGAHRSEEAMRKLEPWFMERTQATAIGRAVAGEAFRQIRSFAAFGFCKSHSAALARTAYEGLFLKRYHPAAFAAGLLSNQPLGFYPPEVIHWDARRHGVEFRRVDINRSGPRCTLEGELPAVRLGFEQVRWVGKEIAGMIAGERATAGPYRSLTDFCERTGVAGKPAEGLILAGAFDGLDDRPRSQQLWELYGQSGSATRPALRASDEAVDLPEPSEHAQMLRDHLVLGFSLSQHFTTSHRRRLRALGVVPSRELARLPDGQEVRVGGLVVCRQRPQTAKGYVFLTLEDQWGLVNVIAAPRVFEAYRVALRDSTLIAVAGRLQRAFGTINVIASRAIALDPRIPDGPGVSPREPITASIRSRDFR